jgi:hypothetical protein
MERIHRLSIFNSKYLLILIVLFTITGVTGIEYFYIVNKIPVDHGQLNLRQVNMDLMPKVLIIGDSRAIMGISSDEIKSVIPEYSFYNIALTGASIYSQFNRMNSIANVKGAIICVTPANIFGNFANPKKKANYEILQPLMNRIFKQDIPVRPNKFFETLITKEISGRFRFPYGFSGLTETILYGDISNYYTRTGWNCNIRLGSDENFAKIVNLLFYQTKLLENSNDNSLIEYSKQKFDSCLSRTVAQGLKILVVRIPVSREIHAVEEEKFYWFDSYLNEVCSKYKISYCNRINGFQYPGSNCDGSHLPSFAAREYSKDLAKYHLQYLN